MNKDLHKYSDAELLSFYRRTRKPDYLIGLYERYMPLVYGVALKYLKNVPDAQDAVMQIWEELFEKVWHEKYYKNSNNTVMVHIRHLREKMSAPTGKSDFIKTVWGVGYKVEE